MVAGVLKIPMAILIDKYGVKKLLVIVIFMTSMGAILFAVSDGFYCFLIARMLMAVSYASALLCAVKVISQYFNARLYAFSVGFILFMGYLGASFAGGPLALLIHEFDIKTTFIAIGILGIAMMLLIFFFMENGENINSNVSLKDFFISSLKILKNKQIIYLGLYTGLIVSGAICIADLWGKLYFVNIYGMDKVIASSVSTTPIYLGISFGALIWGFLHSTLNFTNKILKIAAVSMFVLIAVFFVMPKYASIETITIVAFLLGVMASVKVVCYELIKKFVTYDNLAITVALLAMSVTFGSFIVQMLVGLIEYVISHLTNNITISYSAVAVSLSLLMFVAFFCASKIQSVK